MEIMLCFLRWVGGMGHVRFVCRGLRVAHGLDVALLERHGGNLLSRWKLDQLLTV